MKKSSSTKERKGRVRISSQERERLIRDYYSSGLSQMAYARKCAITYTTFAGWIQRERRRSKLQTNDSAKSQVNNENFSRSAPFAQVDLSMPTQQAYPLWGWELELKNAALLRIHRSVPTSSVLELVEFSQTLSMDT